MKEIAIRQCLELDKSKVEEIKHNSNMSNEDCEYYLLGVEKSDKWISDCIIKRIIDDGLIDITIKGGIAIAELKVVVPDKIYNSLYNKNK